MSDGDETDFVNLRSTVLVVPFPTLHHGLRNQKLMLLVQKIIDFGLVVIENDGKPFSLSSDLMFLFLILLITKRDTMYVKNHVKYW